MSRKVSISDYQINMCYELVLKGYVAQEIKREMWLTDQEYKAIHETARFHKLMHSTATTPNLVTIKEIEDNLFTLLYSPKDKDVNRRINALQIRYANFLI